MRALVILFVIAATAKLPDYNPKPVDKLASPNKQYLAMVYDGKHIMVTQNRQTGGPKMVVHGHYDDLNRGRGVTHLSWSPDSRYLAFDFLINHSARLTMDGASFIGVIDMQRKKIWLLLPIRGCQPRFLDDKTIEFLSFEERLHNGPKGTPAYETEGSMLYRHKTKEWEPSDPGYVFNSDQIIDFLNDFALR